MKLFLSFITTTLFTLLVVQGCKKESPITPPDENQNKGNGKIYYNQVVDQSANLMWMNSDGTDNVIFIQDAAIVTSPTNGRMFIAVQEETDDVYKMTDLEGNVHSIITPVNERVQVAVLSPDASNICYGYWDLDNQISQNVYTLHVVNADGTGDIKITEQAGWENTAAFSPDGSQLVFYLDEGGSPQDKLYVVNTDGTNLRLLTDNAKSINDNFYSLAWSPRGDQILFIREGEFSGQDVNQIWSINPDGSDLKQLTDGVVPDGLMPRFSPDGSKIVFVGSGSDLSNPGPDIWIMDADGSNKQNLTNTPGLENFELRPEWSPDGSQILYVTFDWSGPGDPSSGTLNVVDITSGQSTTLVSSTDVHSGFWGQ